MFLKKSHLIFRKCLTSALCFHCFCIKAEVNNTVSASTSISQIRPIELIDTIQLQLDNGMTFCLRPSNSETGEVFFKLSALGGFASLNSKDFYSGALADKIAWESGMGGMTSDQISVFLYENALEFVMSISPFSRTVEAEGQEESIEAFLQCIKMLFTEQQFTKEGFKTAKNLTKEIISKLSNDNEHVYEAAFLRINTQNFQPLRPLTIEDLAKVNFDNAKDFFYRSFFDPADFFCVITGKFDVQKVVKLIEHKIGVIPKPNKGSELKNTFSVPFPQGITETAIQLINQTSCLTHVTFPVKFKINDLNIDEIAFMCQIMEARLRHVITNKMNLSYGVDVSYEFPVYPFLDNPWISIRYRCEYKFIEALKAIIISELKRLQSQGVTTEEVATIKKLEEGSQEFWHKDDFYWVSMLTNYHLWGWNPEKIDFKNTSLRHLSVEAVNAVLKNAISLNNYSVITATSKAINDSKD